MRLKWGRLYKKDYRDLKFLMKPDMRKAAGIEYRYWYVGEPLDQGSMPQCVAYAGVKYLNAGPVRNTKLPFTPAQLYKQAQKNDEWPGEAYEGTSVRGLFKYLNKVRYIPRYEWTFDAVVLAAHILTVGPVVVGTDWMTGMMEPDSKGVIHATGTTEGGHGYCVFGYNRKTTMFRMINSWGDWGKNGKAWISRDDMQRLLAMQGEACTATEVRI